MTLLEDIQKTIADVTQERDEQLTFGFQGAGVSNSVKEQAKQNSIFLNAQLINLQSELFQAKLDNEGFETPVKTKENNNLRNALIVGGLILLL